VDHQLFDIVSSAGGGRAARRVLAGALVAAAVLASVACGSSSKSSHPMTAPVTTAKPKGSTSSKSKPAAASSGQAAPAVASAGTRAGKTCIPVTEGLRHKILGSVVLVGATLHHMEAVASPLVRGYYFVSGTVDGSGTHHRLATWATADLSGRSPVYAVDSFAALISMYGAATAKNPDLSTRSPGSYRSRVCAAGPKADFGAPAPVSGVGNAPASG
jgi:hypothetical protein